MYVLAQSTSLCTDRDHGPLLRYELTDFPRKHTGLYETMPFDILTIQETLHEPLHSTSTLILFDYVCDWLMSKKHFLQSPKPLNLYSFLHCSPNGGRRRANLALYLPILFNRSSLSRARTFLARSTCLFKRSESDNCFTESSSSLSCTRFGSSFGKLVSTTSDASKGFGKHVIVFASVCCF